MGSQMLIVRDVRLEGSKPKGNEVLEVDADTPISWPISWIHQRAKAHNSEYVWLKILAHGYETPGLPLATGWSTTRESTQGYSQGGSGIQFCKEGLTLHTIALFKPLFEWLDWTDIYSCGAAFITPGHEGRYGDGNILCSRLAQILGSPVRASTATQYYDPDGTNFGAWEGTVLTYGPKGNVINVEHNPQT
jgi:hypothetical protein